jgi:hypothetical protein
MDRHRRELDVARVQQHAEQRVHLTGRRSDGWELQREHEQQLQRLVVRREQLRLELQRLAEHEQRLVLEQQQQRQQQRLVER